MYVFHLDRFGSHSRCAVSVLLIASNTHLSVIVFFISYLNIYLCLIVTSLVERMCGYVLLCYSISNILLRDKML